MRDSGEKLRVWSGCHEEVRDVEKERGLGGHCEQDPGPSFGGLDRTWEGGR